ncbi:hypothetical protein U6B65_10445 [Oscillospiraceae bacterium MB08-C2-2]|nr:hypothetical protein U6B65_10445 [Oscillospiraceae bacterium MB08-C2-2]
MQQNEKALHFFLGANTPQGFVSRFDQLADTRDGWRSLIIKGGPGSGKSTMMKTIAANLDQEGEPLEMIHCSSDVDSLDAVIDHNRRFSIADGTSPHVIDPKYPGAFESIIDLTSCWDDSKLFACRDEIIPLAQRCSRCHEHCCRFLAAAGSLMSDTYRLALECVNTQKLASHCARLALKEFKPLKNAVPKERVRFLTAVTNKGVVSFTDTAKKLCDRVYLITDDYGAVSRLMLTAMRSKALEAGYDVISCYCPLAPFDKLEQLFIPKLRIGFMTSNRFHNYEEAFDPYRIINYQRFTDNHSFKQKRKRISFNRKVAAQMVEQAQNLLAEAKTHHDELESYYIAAMDFKKAESLTEKTIKKIQTF